MANPPLSDQIINETIEAVKKHGGVRAASRATGITYSTLFSRYETAKIKMGDDMAKARKPNQYKEMEFEHAIMPPSDVPIETRIAQRLEAFEQKRRYEDAAKLRRVKINIDGPFGILHFGDPHVDDDGTDIKLLYDHVNLVNTTQGLFGANIGDTSNNWVGRLHRKFADQRVRQSEAWEYVEHFLKSVKWLYLVGGNHDVWSEGTTITDFMLRGSGNQMINHGVRLALETPNGPVVRVNARHEFTGHSQWNPVHGAGKNAQMLSGDHLYINGHKHVSGYMPIKYRSQDVMMHAVQVGSYKIYDDYANEKGFVHDQFSPACVTIIDPSKDPSTPAFLKVDFDIEGAAAYLKYLRAKQGYAPVAKLKGTAPK
jgi:hypothetical protein